MTGQELIDFIKKNKLEDYVFKTDLIPYGGYPEDASIEEIAENNINIKDDNTVEIY